MVTSKEKEHSPQLPFRVQTESEGQGKLQANWVPAERWLQCLQIYPKVMSKHAEVPKEGQEEEGEKSKGVWDGAAECDGLAPTGSLLKLM